MLHVICSRLRVTVRVYTQASVIIWIYMSAVFASIVSQGLKEQLKELREKHPGKVIFYSTMVDDGAGCTAKHMLRSAAYAHIHGWIYGGAIRDPSQSSDAIFHGVDVKEMTSFVFGRKVSFSIADISAMDDLKLQVLKVNTSELQKIITTPPRIDIIWLDFQEPEAHCEVDEGDQCSNALSLSHIPHFDSLYKSPFEEHGSPLFIDINQWMQDSFLSALRESNGYLLNAHDILFKPDVPSVAIHVRRGDVSVASTAVAKKNRYLPHEFYYDIADRIRSVLPTADMHVFSSLEGEYNASEFNGYRERGISVHLDEVHAKQAWTNMIVADILIMSRHSCFSYIPAVLNHHCAFNRAQDKERKLRREWLLPFSETAILSCALHLH